MLPRSLEAPKEAHTHTVQPTLTVTASNELRSAGGDAANPFVLIVDSIQIYRNIVAWKLFIGPRPEYRSDDPPGPCDIEVWDWTIGERLWVSSSHPHKCIGVSSQ